MIQDPSKNLTLIVYNTPAPPRYLKVDKKLVRVVLLVVPTLVILFLSASFLYSVFLKNKVSELRSLEPTVMKKLEEQKEKYEAQISQLTQTNSELTLKLSRGSFASETTSSLLSFFIVPLDSKDLRSKELISLEETQIKSSGGKIKLIFNMNNNTSENTKLTGYMTVVQYQGNLVQFYPKYELNEKNLKLEYASGEYYSFSRLRPTEVVFDKLSTLSSRFKVYLFSRTGDLILYKQIGPFNIE